MQDRTKKLVWLAAAVCLLLMGGALTFNGYVSDGETTTAGKIDEWHAEWFFTVTAEHRKVHTLTTINATADGFEFRLQKPAMTKTTPPKVQYDAAAGANAVAFDLVVKGPDGEQRPARGQYFWASGADIETDLTIEFPESGPGVYRISGAVYFHGIYKTPWTTHYKTTKNEFEADHRVKGDWWEV